ncbi:MAG: S8 family serine peptidase [Anaerolineae bacterium]
MNGNSTVRRGRRWGFASLVLIAALVLVASAQSAAAPARQAGVPFDTIPLPPEALSWTPDSLPDARAVRNPNLDSTMADLAAAAEDSVQTALALAESQSLRVSDDRVHVQIVTHAPGLQRAMQMVTGAGGEVTKVGNDATLIQGWLPIRALEAVAADDDVYLIRRPAEVVLAEEVLSGNSTTEGLAVINGPAWHAEDHRGAGVKMGIIDGGFEGYPGLLGTDLPASVTVKNFVDGETDVQVDGTTKHGTACAEIIHDIAPDSALYLVKVATNLDLQQAVDWLIDEEVNVISTSLGWYNVTPGDGTGEFADLVQYARDAGVLWVTAAGNDREAHWGGPYYDPEDKGTHHYSDNRNVNYFGSGDGTPDAIGEGHLVEVFLRWDDWANVDQDYDLVLLRWNGSSWDAVAAGQNVQDGSPGQTPTEFAAAVTSGGPTYYGFAIVRRDSDRDVNLEVFAPNIARLDKVLHARSLANLADAPGAMTVAALDVNSPYPQEPYSSEGPTNGPGGAEAGGFTKPDIAAFANVSTMSYGAMEFAGTSAATPHVAGGAALVLGAYPSHTPDELQSFLEERAVDMGPAGMDTISGHGRLYLGDPPAPPAGKTWNGSIDTDWHNPANWTPNGVPTSEDDVTIPAVPNAPIISADDAAVNSLTVDAGGILDLTTRILWVEGTLISNGTLKQTQGVAQGRSTEFLRITSLSGTQTKYYGLDISPAGAASTTWDLMVNTLPIPSESFGPHSLNGDDLDRPAAPLADVELILDDGSQEKSLVVTDGDNSVETRAVLFNHFDATTATFPFTLERIDIHQSTNNLQGEEIELLAYADVDGGDLSNATLLHSEIVTVQDETGWNVYTLTTPVVYDQPAHILIGFSTYYADGGVSWPYQDRYPYPLDETDPQNRSYILVMDDPSDPVDPSDLSSFDHMVELNDMGYPGNWMIRGYGSLDGVNSPPTLSGLPDQTVPMNSSASGAIDLWAYANDAEDADADLTFAIVNSPNPNAGVSIDSNRYIDINPATGWTGQTDVEVRVQDTGGLSDTDTFQVTVTGADPAIDVTPTVFDESVPQDETLIRTLTIGNTGGEDLTYVIDDGGVTWLSQAPSSGTIAGGEAQPVDVTFDAAGLAEGDYSTTLTVTHNDPNEDPVTISVDMHVTVTDDLTNVTVSVSGNQFCAGRAAGVERCFDIDSPVPLSATVRFYFSEDERNGQPLSDLRVFHYDGGWTEEPGPYTCGGAGDAQYVEVQNVDDFSLFALDTVADGSFVYLPVVLRSFPVVPDAPVLNVISNPDGDGSYGVSWSPSEGATTYTLQEATAGDFHSASPVYSGPNTSQAISGRDVGTYYYRVRASNPSANSDWSNIRSVEVTVPAPACEQHDFGMTNGYWYVYSSGKTWEFTARSDMAVREVEVKSVLASPGGTFHILVKINGNTVASWDQYVNDTTFKAYYHSAEVSFDMNAGDSIVYHIYGGTFSNPVGGISGMNYIKLCK